MSLTSERAEKLLRETLVNKCVCVALRAPERREILGVFICVDHEGNVVLRDVTEVRFSGSDENPATSKRPVPLTMIPGHWIASVKATETQDAHDSII